MAASDLAIRFFTGYNERDIDAVVSGFADGAVYHGLQNLDGKLSRRDYVGKDEIKLYLGTFLATSGGSYIHYDLRTVAETGNLVLIEWSDVARSAAGAEYRNQGTNVFEFNDEGQIVDVRMYCDWSPLVWGSEWRAMMGMEDGEGSSSTPGE